MLHLLLLIPFAIIFSALLSKVAIEWLEILHAIWKVTDYIFGSSTTVPTVMYYSLQSIRQMLGFYYKIGHSHFLLIIMHIRSLSLRYISYALTKASVTNKGTKSISVFAVERASLN
jgi:hypothetical protein